MMLKPKEKHLLWILPVFYGVWYLIRHHATGPYYSYSIDPEYPYLFNSLGAALLEFDRIGHIDHPGTPFQLFTGIVVRLTHLLLGRGDIVSDVAARPELYLGAASLALASLTTLVLIWLGRLAEKAGQPKKDSLILQSGFLVSAILLDVQSRYIPDQLQIICTFLLIGITYLYLYRPDYHPGRYALISGLIVALGFTTKIHFAPFFLLPLILLFTHPRYSLHYVGSFLVSGALILMPIYRKLKHTKTFAMKMATHDGIYGKGNERFLDPEKFFRHIGKLIEDNTFFFVCAGIMLLLSIIVLFDKRHRRLLIAETRMAWVLSLVIILSTAVIAKHYKNYYALPMVATGGMILLIITRLLASYLQKKYVYGLVTVAILLVGVFHVHDSVQTTRKQKQRAVTRARTEMLIAENMGPDDLFLATPSWKSAPYPYGGLLFGMSYAGRHHINYTTFSGLYPNILTLEEGDTRLYYWRMVAADNESLIKSGKTFLLYDSPAHRYKELSGFLKEKFNAYEIPYAIDTLIANLDEQEYLIAFKNLGAWQVVDERNCSFEMKSGDNFLADDGISILHGKAHTTARDHTSGQSSLLLSDKDSRGPAFHIPAVREGDIVQAEVCVRYRGFAWKENFTIGYTLSGNDIQDSLSVTQESYLSHDVQRNWKLMRYTFLIQSQPADSMLIVYPRFEGNGEILMDDFRITHIGKRP